MPDVSLALIKQIAKSLTAVITTATASSGSTIRFWTSLHISSYLFFFVSSFRLTVNDILMGLLAGCLARSVCLI